jgi:hypothetical protein
MLQRISATHSQTSEHVDTKQLSTSIASGSMMLTNGYDPTSRSLPMISSLRLQANLTGVRKRAQQHDAQLESLQDETKEPLARASKSWSYHFTVSTSAVLQVLAPRNRPATVQPQL